MTHRVQLVVMLPAIDHLMADIGNRQFRDTIGTIMKVSIFSSVVFYAPYPIILLTTFRKSATVDAMDQPALPTAEVLRS